MLFVETVEHKEETPTVPTVIPPPLYNSSIHQASAVNGVEIGPVIDHYCFNEDDNAELVKLTDYF